MNDIFSKLFSSIDLNIYETLDDITFINSDIINNFKIQKIVGKNLNDGILLICNALIFGIIIYYATSYLVSHLTMNKVQKPYEFIFRLIIFGIIMNNSVFICEQIINLISIISTLSRQIGENLFGESICFSNFIKVINEKVYMGENINLFSFDGLIKSFITIGFVNLIFTNSLRYIMIQVFSIISPFAILTLVSPKSSNFFKKWLISFVSLLSEQILISIILVLAFSFGNFMEENFQKLIYIGILYALTKTNIFMNQILGGISTTIDSGFNLGKGGK